MFNIMSHNIENLKMLSKYFNQLDDNNFDLTKVMYLGFDNDYSYFRDFIQKNKIELKNEEKGIIYDIIFIIWIENFTGLKYVKDKEVYCWLFDHYWASFNNKKTDPTPQGISKRIDWFLEFGLPDDYSKQMIGETELCYISKNI
jgi:hypothetical protein